MKNQSIIALIDEVTEIAENIKAAARAGEITWQQREDLLTLVYQDENTKLQLAANLLHDWTGQYHPRAEALAA